MKFFTFTEANKTLPLVSQIAKDIQKYWHQLSELKKECENGHKDKEMFAIETINKLQFCVLELKEIGCELKDFEIGLVNFPAKLGNKIVYLCWHLGETEIRYWHEENENFKGRRMVDERFLLAHS